MCSTFWRAGLALLMMLALLLVPARTATAGAPAREDIGRPAVGRRQLAVSYHHVCALLADGAVRCWGRNEHGQLGDGTTTDRSVPIIVAGLTEVVALTGGYAHTCALRADGTARCWGDNPYGQLGDGTTIDRLAPTVVGGATPLTGIVALEAGQAHTCAVLSDGTARCWGQNIIGQLGDGTTTQRTLPVAVGGATPLTGIVGIDGGGEHSCAVLSDGTARCWGGNGGGRLGDGTTTMRSTPVVVGGGTPLAGAISISAGHVHTCAVLADGTARCWGQNVGGALGDGSTTSRSTPVTVGGATPLLPVAMVDAGLDHTCALLASGESRCWGMNASNQLGDGTTTSRTLPVVVGVPTPLKGAISISVGAFSSCAALAGGGVRCWGHNQYGTLGDGTTTLRPQPTAVQGLTPPANRATQVSVGQYHSCAAMLDGTARCWGRNASGQLGDGTTINHRTPVLVGGATLLTGVVSVSSMGFFSCALIVDSTARCWGENDRGQLGDGTTTNRSTPVVVGGRTPLTNIVTLSAGHDYACALLSDSTARCWGANANGQHGNGSFATSNLTPVVVGGATPLTGIVGIAAGLYHSCFYLADGTAHCSGLNDRGGLGDGSTNTANVPVTVGGTTPLTTVVSISVGQLHTCAILADSSGRCWGYNAKGQLGNGTTDDTATPVAIGVAAPITALVGLSAGYAYTCAALADGTARCWGDNEGGQLGNGTAASSAAPVPVGGATPLRGIVGVSASMFHSCAALVDGSVFCWGRNLYGQLGDGTITDSLTPVLVDFEGEGSTAFPQLFIPLVQR